MRSDISRRIAAEFIGTAFLLAAVVGSGIMADKLSAGNVGLALLCNAIATGAALYVLITIFGPISGAHFNPAVTAIMLLNRQIETLPALTYVGAQVLGGIFGVIVAHAMFDQSLLQTSTTSRTGLAQWTAEFVAAFGLILTILGTVRFRPEAVPTAVGLYIVSAYWFTASTSFANPAVTIARSLSNTFAGIAPGDVLLFIVAQMLGALAALIIAKWLFSETTN
ncbi:MAG: aquaporin family protein [Hyphomicrobium sp.]|nr:MAG: aquaporin family protein [Hyphomicrobium sp.]PPC98745.1 MAG: aquaporin family protein [Hyphomicrobium sp.]